MVDVQDRHEQSIEADSLQAASVRRRREGAALALAISALVCAIIGAYGPADRVRTTYSWPPSDPPSARAAGLWYSPLLLAAQRPERVTVTIPCGVGPTSAASNAATVVLATARRPPQAGALAITRKSGQLVISVNDQVLRRLPATPASAGTDSDCTYQVTLADGRWSISGGLQDAVRTGELDAMPRVFGFFSEIDPATTLSSSIAVTTTPHTTVVTKRQTAAWIFATAFLAAAFVLIAWPIGLMHAASAAKRSARAALAHAHVTDGLVGTILLVWLVIAPLTFDDGWIVARERMYDSSGGFSLYYTTLGANLPLDYWLEWTHHWLAEASTSLVVLRLPTLLCLGGIWVLCRWMLGRITTLTGHTIDVRWALAAGFLVGAVAWGMTLRPEPTTALISTAVAAAVFQFVTKPTIKPVTLVALLVPFALTAHTTGIVVLAPLLAALPELCRWTREHVRAALSLLTCSAALLTTLLFVGSDFSQRRFDASVSQSYASPLRDEFSRYALMNGESWGTPLRRLMVGLVLLTVVAYVLRRRREGTRLVNYPASTLALSLVLFAAIPSKWPWHFAVLIGFGATAVAAETLRVRLDGYHVRGWQLWPFVAVASAAAVAYWTWWMSVSWNPADLQTIRWYDGLAAALGLLALLVPLYVIGAGILIAYVRRSGSSNRVPWRVAGWTAWLLAAPALAYTVGILAVDTVRTDSWTLARQNVDAVLGKRTCGLADSLLAPVAPTRPLERATQEPVHAPPRWVPPAPQASLSRFVLSPIPGESSSTPWFRANGSPRVGTFLTGRPSAGDHLYFDWGRRVRGEVRMLRRDEWTRAARSLAGTSSWRALTSGRALNVPTAPDSRSGLLVRVSYRGDSKPGAALAVTSPGRHRAVPLAERMNEAGTALVYPELLPYFPCATLPRLRHGAVAIPSHIVLSDLWLRAIPGQLLLTPDLRDVLRSSPFRGVLDIYALQPIPVESHSDYDPTEVLVFEVKNSIDGLRVPPEVTTIMS